MSQKNNNFAVIDIGTNAIKCIAFVDGRQVDTFTNKILTQTGENNLNPEEVLNHVTGFMKELEEQGISSDRIYIAATEGFRKSTNQAEISKKVKARTGRSIHKISPRKEAYLAALGGLSYIQKGFKGNPAKVIYIEAGGGSTEVSLIDASKRSVLKIEKTISIPLGSKSKVNAEQISEMMNGFARAVNKSVGKDDEIAIVINSSAASRIIARRFGREKYNPKAVAEKQYTMRGGNFLKKLGEIIGMDKEKIKEQFYLNEEMLDGFINHSAILQAILKKLYHTAQKAQLSTTIGGLKHGLAREIAAANEKDIDKIFNSKTQPKENSVTINSRGEDVEQKIEKIQENKQKTLAEHNSEQNERKDKKDVWQVKVKEAVFEANKSAKGRFDFREVKEQYSKKSTIAFEDKLNKNNKIKFNAQDNVSIYGDINAYYAVCETAKRLGKNIKFGSFKKPESKALLYQVCLERKVTMENEPSLDELKDCPNFVEIKRLLSKLSKAPKQNVTVNKFIYADKARA